MSEANLQHELKTYEAHRMELAATDEGKYVLIHGDEIAGTWDTYKDAVQEGYNRFGLKPFLVKRIEVVDTVHNFTRNVQPCPS